MEKAGRFNLSWPYLLYAALCNLWGSLCLISLFSYLRRLPDFIPFLATHHWVGYLQMTAVLSIYIALSHNHAQRSLPPLKKQEDDCENPDNYRFSRTHVWGNLLHLLWTLSLICIFTLCLFAYLLAHFRTLPLTWGLLWTFLATVGFLLHACLSPYAKRIQVLGIGNLFSGSISLSLLTLGLFLSSSPSLP